MLTVPFLTDLDPRAAVKGSRDPLGVQVIWTQLGRSVVSNLTTVTANAHEFLTLLLGVYFCQRVENGQAKAEHFLRFEQVAAYSRAEYGSNPGAVRGIERVKANLQAGDRLSISADQRDQILSDQRTYGLWGLFLSASRESGLIEERSIRLTPFAQKFVERHFSDAIAHEPRIRKLIFHPAPTTLKLRGADAEIGRCLAKHLAGSKIPAGVRRELRDVLVRASEGNRTGSQREHKVQMQLAELLADNTVLTGPEFGSAFVLSLLSPRARGV